MFRQLALSRSSPATPHKRLLSGTAEKGTPPHWARAGGRSLPSCSRLLNAELTRSLRLIYLFINQRRMQEVSLKLSHLSPRLLKEYCSPLYFIPFDLTTVILTTTAKLLAKVSIFDVG